jgi:iron complex transport system substrate-binding protein
MYPGIMKSCFIYQIPFFLVILVACTSAPSEETSASTIIYTDDLGRQLLLNKPPERIMALAPSMTEILFAVCDTSQIVAVTQNCNFPEAVRSKPVVNNYPMDYEALLKAKPDMIFTVEGITPLADAERIMQMNIPVYYQKYTTVEGIFESLADIGKIMGRTTQANQLIDSLRNTKEIIVRRTESLPKPKTLAITWQDPIYAYGKNSIFTDKLRIAGAINAIDTVFDAPFPALTREYVLKINPDIILGGGFEHMDSTFFRLYPELKKTNAYRNKRIYDVTDDLQSRPSPRVVQSILEIEQLIHPAPAQK